MLLLFAVSSALCSFCTGKTLPRASAPKGAAEVIGWAWICAPSRPCWPGQILRHSQPQIFPVNIPDGAVWTGKLGSTGQQPERSRRAMPPLLGQDSSLSSACLWDPKGIFSYFSARQRGKKPFSTLLLFILDGLKAFSICYI